MANNPTGFNVLPRRERVKIAMMALMFEKLSQRLQDLAEKSGEELDLPEIDPFHAVGIIEGRITPTEKEQAYIFSTFKNFQRIDTLFPE